MSKTKKLTNNVYFPDRYSALRYGNACPEF